MDLYHRKQMGRVISLTLRVKGRRFRATGSRAADALGFIADTGAFYVRELPGELTDEEKVALIATPIEYKVLRSAP